MSENVSSILPLFTIFLDFYFPYHLTSPHNLPLLSSLPPLSSSHFSSSSFLAPSPQSNQQKRQDDFPRLNWPGPSEEIGEAELNALKAAWEPLITAELSSKNSSTCIVFFQICLRFYIYCRFAHLLYPFE